MSLFFQFAKVQTPHSQHRDQQRERGHGDHGHGTAPGSVPAGWGQAGRRAAAARALGGPYGRGRGRPRRARDAARPLGRPPVRGGVRHDSLYSGVEQD